jgi:uncharacterized protein YprB with RNaseH-like and TPR domain
MPYAERSCRGCGKSFTPPNSGGKRGTIHLEFCPNPCRQAAQAALDGVEVGSDVPQRHRGIGSPIKQIVFDLETSGLDRAWGTTLVGCFLIHGLPEGPVMKTFRADEYDSWKKGRRSEDKSMVQDIQAMLRKYGSGAIAYAHNGDRFDMKWLRTVSLKYRLDSWKIKLVDPCSVAWKKYLLGRNSLDALADFLKLKHQKMHLSPDVWRKVALDDDKRAWNLLVRRCQSDVLVLNELAGRVTNDVGMIDFNGSWR